PLDRLNEYSSKWSSLKCQGVVASGCVFNDHFEKLINYGDPAERSGRAYGSNRGFYNNRRSRPYILFH
ncbi:hypothetical protein, partial [Sulfitobacter sp.]|uniref:hypothetical protein n=1 Tax=Sulfitobacter sp. TaxID=1903071 RepID=UPI003EFA9978